MAHLDVPVCELSILQQKEIRRTLNVPPHKFCRWDTYKLCGDVSLVRRESIFYKSGKEFRILKSKTNIIEIYQ